MTQNMVIYASHALIMTPNLGINMRNSRLLGLKKLNRNNITTEDLVREALSIPYGWTEEVYVSSKRGKITFSSPLTSNSYTKDPDRIGRIESMAINDFSGFHERNDGMIEGEDEYGDRKGEYYDKCIIIDRDEAIERISNLANFEEILSLIEARQWIRN